MTDVNDYRAMAKSAVQGDGAVASTAFETQSALTNEYLGLAGEDVINDRTLAQFAYEAGTTVFQQVPQIAATAAAAYLGGPVVGRIAGAALMGGNTYGQSYAQAIKEGYNKEQATGYALANGISETCLTYLLGGVGKVSGTLVSGITDKAGSEISSPVLKATLAFLARTGGEFIEEGSQGGIIDPLSRNVFFGEDNAIDWKEFGYQGLLGAISAAVLGGGEFSSDLRNNIDLQKVGATQRENGSTAKLVDTILNNPITKADGATSAQVKAYNEAAEIAQRYKDGSKVADMSLGVMEERYAAAGGDISFLTSPDTQTYNKDSISQNDMVAGTKARLAQLGAENTDSANAIVKTAMGQELTTEEQAAFDASPHAQTIVNELKGDLIVGDSQNALSLAATASTARGIQQKTYAVVKAANPDKTVASPVTTALQQMGAEYTAAAKQSAIITKVLSGEAITEAEAATVAVGGKFGSMVRTVVASTLGIDLTEASTAADILAAFNEKAAEYAKIKAQQQALASTAAATAQANAVNATNKATGKEGGGYKARPRVITGKGGSSNGNVTGGSSIYRGRGAQAGNNDAGGNRSGELKVQARVRNGNDTQASDRREGQSPVHGEQRLQQEVLQKQQERLNKAGIEGKVIPTEDYTEEQREIHRGLIEAGFGRVVMYNSDGGKAGGIRFNSEEGIYEVFICANGKVTTAPKSAAHESTHLMLKAIDDKARNGFVQNTAKAIYGEHYADYYNATLKPYAAAYPSFDVIQLTAAVQEEMICNAKAGMLGKALAAELQAKATEELADLEALSKGTLAKDNALWQLADNSFFEAVGLSPKTDTSTDTKVYNPEAKAETGTDTKTEAKAETGTDTKTDEESWTWEEFREIYADDIDTGAITEEAVRAKWEWKPELSCSSGYVMQVTRPYRRISKLVKAPMSDEFIGAFTVCLSDTL